MVQDAPGDIFGFDADVYVCPTNARGVFGAGLAKKFAAHWPHIVPPYEIACRLGEVGPGDVRPDLLGPGMGKDRPVYVALFATKDHWADPSKIEWIERGLGLLDIMLRCAFFVPRRRVVMPAIGCGLGGLPFDLVRSLVYDRFDRENAPSDFVLIPPMGHAGRV